MSNEATEDTFFADLPEDVVHEALKPKAAWVAGVYDGTIESATPYQADKPDAVPCVKLQVAVTNREGKTLRKPAYVLFKSQDSIRSSLKFFEAVGLSRADYRNPAQLVGLTGKVYLDNKASDDGERTFNQIKNFVVERRA